MNKYVGLNPEGELYREEMEIGAENEKGSKICKASHKLSPLSCLLYKFLNCVTNLLEKCTF